MKLIILAALLLAPPAMAQPADILMTPNTEHGTAGESNARR